MQFEKPKNQKIQNSFDLLFPEHKGHYLQKLCSITDLSQPFVCSCGEILRITIKRQIEEEKEGEPFFNYMKNVANKFYKEYDCLNKQANKLGFILLSYESINELAIQVIESQKSQKTNL